MPVGLQKKRRLYSYRLPSLNFKKNNMTEITIKSYDLVVSIKKEADDVDIHDMLEMFTSALVGVTFPVEVIENGILEMAEEIEFKRKEN
jgi:hypothetical protein